MYERYLYLCIFIVIIIVINYNKIIDQLINLFYGAKFTQTVIVQVIKKCGKMFEG